MNGALSLQLDHGGPVARPFTPWPEHTVHSPLFQRFAAMVAEHGPHPAVVAGGRSWSYAQLHELALCIAADIERQVPPGGVVAFLLPSDGRLFAGFLAALAVGRIYVPLDPSFPPARNAAIVAHAGVACLYSTPTAAPALAGGDWIDIDALPPAQPKALAQDVDAMAYILYTSGSTGNPKGVYQRQRAMLADIYNYTHAIHIQAADRFTCLYSPSTNGALRDIYGALLNGATVYAMDLHQTSFAGMADVIAQQQLTVVHAMPPVIRAFLASAPSALQLASVRLLYVAGERLFRQDVAAIYRHFPGDALIYFGIGSTENSTLFRHRFLDRNTSLPEASLAVGWAIPGIEVCLCDGAGKTVATGEIGEIEVYSRWLAAGYWGDPYLTTEVFGADPRPGYRRLRTGDLGRLGEDGLLEFLGRKDRQIKIRGYRVDPGAVEAEIRALPGVSDAAVLAHGEPPRLLAFYASTDPQLDSNQLRAALALTLPSYALPGEYLFLPAIPTLPNFKHDHSRLRELAEQLPHTFPGLAGAGNSSANRLPTEQPPSDVLHQQVWQAWLQVFPHASQADGVTFAHLGGDSLAALALATAIEKATGQVLIPQDLHDQLTAETLLTMVRAHSGRATAPLYMVTGALAGVARLAPLANCLAQHLPIKALRLPSFAEERGHLYSMAEYGRYLAEQIMADAPQQPVQLLGFSFGAQVACEAAQRLVEANIRVGRLLMYDIPALPLPPPPHVLRQAQRAGNMLQDLLGHAFSGQVWLRLFRGGVRRIAGRCAAYSVRRVGHRGWLRCHTVAGRLLFGRWRVYAQMAMLFEWRRWLARGWRARHFPGEVVLIKGEIGLGRWYPSMPDMGWADVARTVRIVTVPGGHTPPVEGEALSGAAAAILVLLAEELPIKPDGG